MALTLADVLRHFGPQYLREHELSAPQARAWRDILSCRSGALGGQRLQCDSCGHTRWQYHSCRHRACPQLRISANVTGDFGNVTDLGDGAGLRG